MVRTIKQTKNPVNSKLFLNSINSWYNDEGIKCEVSNVGAIFTSSYKNDPQIPIELNILDEMPQCRARVYDEEGNIEKILDDATGDEIDKIIKISNPKNVTFFFTLKDVSSNAETLDDPEYIVGNRSNAFGLFNRAFIESGDLPNNNEDSFIVNHDEMKNTLVGFKFLAKCGKGKFNKKQYNKLLVYPLPKEEKSEAKPVPDKESPRVDMEKELTLSQMRKIEAQDSNIKDAIDTIGSDPNGIVNRKNIVSELNMMVGDNMISSDDKDAALEVIVSTTWE